MSNADPALANPAESSADRFSASALRQILYSIVGFMFCGMAVWILVLDPNPPSSTPWTGWKWRDVLLSFLATVFLRQMTLFCWNMLLLQVELRSGASTPALVRNLGNLSWQIAFSVLAVFAFALAPNHQDVTALGLVPFAAVWGWYALGIGIIGGPGMMLFGLLLLRMAGEKLEMEGDQVNFLHPGNSADRPSLVMTLGMLLLAVVLGPISEEFLFRGVIYPGLRNELGIWPAVIISSWIFGLAHAGFGQATIIFALVIGIPLALLMEFSGSLWPPILAHVLVNSKLVAVFLWPVAKTDESI